MKQSTVEQHLESLAHLLEAYRDDEKGAQMSKYMKGKFSYLGVSAPERNLVQKEWFASLKHSDVDRWDLVFSLWNMDEREFQYVAIDYLKRFPKKFYRIDDALKLEELITSKSWWDSVDSLASNPVSVYLKLFPAERDRIIEKWRFSDDMWLNRTCLIFQLKYKEDTDFELMKDLIRQYQGVNEFFIQKAIGWALRQYSKTNPSAVRSFISEINLTGLAFREGSKYI